MKQVVQNVRSGITACRELPDPIVQPRSVLVANVASLVSAGTERYVVELTRKTLLGKARERPDDVKRIVQKIRQEGVFETVRQVRAKLDEPMPLGYSSAGIVLAAGDGITRFKAGDRVAVAAPHASVVLVGENLCAQIPEGVSFEQAAYASVGAVALEGIRLADPALGCRILVIGLGLVGQIAACLLKASGVSVLGTDLDAGRLEAARALGITVAGPDDVRATAMSLTAGHGVDAVLITAATTSNGPIEMAADICRQKGRIVLVGVAGTQVPRPPFFEKELEFTVSHSLGPGRSERSYEEKGIDYPIGYVRWTAQRNMETVLEAIASGGLPVDKLTTHRFAIDRAADAYDLVTSSGEPFLGVVLQYDPAAPPARRIEMKSRPAGAQALGVGVIGTGNFARLVALAQIQSAAGVRLRGLCSAHGVNAEQLGRKGGFAFAAADPAEILGDPGTSAVFVLTRHDLHADLVVQALRSGKHVFVEKPLCITAPELQAIAACVEELGEQCPMLMVGFNRRFAPAVATLRAHFNARSPLAVSFRFAVPDLPPDAWPHDPEVGGGRLIGEACHAIDTCAAIVGSLPTRVYAESVSAGPGVPSLDDRVFITIRHENGSVSNVAYQAGGDRGGPTERIEVFGGGRTAVMDDWDRIELWSDGRCTKARGGKDKGHAAEIQAFVAACRSGGAWPIPWPDLYATTWAALAAVRSLRAGEPISGGQLVSPEEVRRDVPERRVTRTVSIRETHGIATNSETVPEELKRSVHRHWSQEPCGTRGADPASRRAYFASIEQQRYEVEPYIPTFAGFDVTRDSRVLEIGVGAGTDYVRWLRAGARAFGIDLTTAGVNLTRERAELEGLRPNVFVADAEALPFRSSVFDVVYSYGVLHHTPDTVRAIKEVHRTLRPGGVARVMIYHRPSIVGFLLWIYYCVGRLQPWRSPRWAIFHHLESPGTKAFTIEEARRLFGPFRTVTTTPILGPGDLLTVKPSTKYLSKPIQLIWRLYPRWAIRLLGDRFGLGLLVNAVK